MSDAHPSTRTLPRGSVARDRNGDYLVTWPDGQYGYDADHRHAAEQPSSSTGPYEVVIDGLTDVLCDDFVRLDRGLRETVLRAWGSWGLTQRPVAGLVRDEG